MSRLLTGVLLGFTLLGAIALGPTAPAHAQAPTTAPSGPALDPPTEQEADDSKQKLVIAVTAIALLGIVVYGNKVRRKRAKK